MIHSCISAAIAFLPVVLTLQECYVCKSASNDGHTELEFQFPGQHIEACQKGVTPTAKQCPPKYKGCLTQYNGEHVTRSCSDLGLTVCQKANKVEYCYCQGNLCNLDEKLDSDPTLPMDDEDESTEGSGFRETVSTSRTTQEPSPAATQPSRKMTSRAGWQQSSYTCLSLILPLVLAMLKHFP